MKNILFKKPLIINFFQNNCKTIEMPSYKLTYFNVQALAEPMRLMFAYAGVDYEDVRFENEDWPKIKPSKYFVFFN